MGHAKRTVTLETERGKGNF